MLQWCQVHAVLHSYEKVEKVCSTFTSLCPFDGAKQCRHGLFYDILLWLPRYAELKKCMGLYLGDPIVRMDVVCGYDTVRIMQQSTVILPFMLLQCNELS